MSQPPPPLPAELQNELGLPPNFGAPDPTTGYYPEADLSGGLPINLDSLRDGPPGSKPFYPYSTLIRYVVQLDSPKRHELSSLSIRYAIKGSPTGKLLLEDIYYAIESRVRPKSTCVDNPSAESTLQFPYFRTAPPGWKVQFPPHLRSYSMRLTVPTPELRPPQPLFEPLLRQGPTTSHGPRQGLVLDR
jgi:forkhead box protein J2/3